MRTNAEKKEFARECLEIERRGGNVQEYIAQNWPSYTPRATWYNLQIGYLGRKKHELTEGKPLIDSDGKEVNTMKKRRDRNEVLDAVLKVLEEKGDPVAWFVNEGYEAPIQAWQAMRKFAKENRPDDYKKIPQDLRKYYADNGIKRPGTDDAAPKASETPTVPKEAVESVFFGGKQYEKMGNPSPTCCQSARPSGVTVPDELPKEKPMEVIGIRSKVKGYYMKADLDPKLMKDDGYVHLIWRDKLTNEERSIGLSVSEWMELSKEIPLAMQQLGLLSK